MEGTDRSDPLPAQLMQPWLEDNAAFIRDLETRSERLLPIVMLREQHEGDIRMAISADPCPLGAIDAASVLVPFGEQVSVLVQVVKVDDDGTTTFSAPERISGIDGLELRLATTPMRVAAECRVLAAVTQPTIADTSYWSFLMEVNQAITREANSSVPALSAAVKSLVDDQTFINMIQNPNVVPMSKTSQSDTFLDGISDRQVLSQLLHPGEYLYPRSLVEGTTGAFGIEKRRFKEFERNMLDSFFKKQLGVVFFKPHAWSRAFRIEGHLDHLRNEKWLMPLLAAITKHTAVNRMVVEPWPQFMADYTAKKVAGVARLYGPMNRHRHPEAHYMRTRT